MAKTRLHFTLFTLLLLTTLACNAPLLNPSPTLAPPPTFAPIRVEPIDENENGNAQPAATVTSQGENTALPTFTPLSVAPTTQSATATPTATATAVTEGALSFTYTIEWRINPDNSSQAIATLTFHPIGGGGSYQYFRDEQPIIGPTSEYIWGSCAGNPGSLRVTAADGQTIKIDYFENPPCP